ncbi:hypothetical protein ACC772_40360, partial [Rhizobium ruizarguesonis]
RGQAAWLENQLPFDAEVTVSCKIDWFNGRASMVHPDDLVRWIMGTWPVPERFQTPMFDRIAAYKPDFDKPLRTPE